MILHLDSSEKCGYVSDVFFAARWIGIGIVTFHMDAFQKCGYLSDVFFVARWIAIGIVIFAYGRLSEVWLCF